MVTAPILNNKPFSDLFANVFSERGYDSFYELHDGDNLVMDNLRNIYSENISIYCKMNKGFEYVKKYCKIKAIRKMMIYRKNLLYRFINFFSINV